MSVVQNGLYKKMFEGVRRNREWFLKNYQELVREYPEEFVAIWDEEVIADTPDLGKLKNKIPNELKGEKPLIKYVSREGIELIL
ncbi:hypothetical protein KKH50_04630 [Patescibacteria group bacterium]|nr:hypothetical protein [Patescibacteria group bacterium]